MNDFIYVPITMDDAEELGYDAKKAFAKGWGTSIDGWLKKVPASEYLKSISSIQGEAVSDAVECVKPIVEDLEKLSNNYEVVAGYYVIQKHTLDAFIENLKTTTNE